MVVGLLRLSRLPLSRWVKYLAVTVLPPLASLLGASVYLDSMLYGVSTFVPFNFLRFNVLTGGSRIFGEHPWHWNFSQGLPAVLSVGLVPALWAILRGDGDGGRGSRVLGWLVAWFLGEESEVRDHRAECKSRFESFCPKPALMRLIYYRTVGPRGMREILRDSAVLRIVRYPL